ncbi:hypothetical protein [Rhizobium sullae]|uniref:hypothetical protein n=1 Tax=Rhizobium sullae TaxID=50338 RepID=UPI0015C5EF3A|nr:hypothetical protein [Rhizobium sullae]
MNDEFIPLIGKSISKANAFAQSAFKFDGQLLPKQQSGQGPERRSGSLARDIRQQMAPVDCAADCFNTDHAGVATPS